MTLIDFIKNFERHTNTKVIYFNISGSHLYGLLDNNSDLDYCGVYIPSKLDILLKRDINSFDNNSNEKLFNDLDFQMDIKMISIYHLFFLLKENKISGFDIIFSSKKAIYKTREIDFIKENFHLFLSKKILKTIESAINQYNVSLNRIRKYIDIENLNKELSNFNDSDCIMDIENSLNDYKFIEFNNDFIIISNKKYTKSIKVSELKLILSKIIYSKTLRSNECSYDSKSTYNSIRIIKEIEELFNEGSISFPLKSTSFLYSIKNCKENLTNIENFLNSKQSLVVKIENSKIQKEPNIQEINFLLIKLIEGLF